MLTLDTLHLDFQEKLIVNSAKHPDEVELFQVPHGILCTWDSYLVLHVILVL